MSAESEKKRRSRSAETRKLLFKESERTKRPPAKPRRGIGRLASSAKRKNAKKSAPSLSSSACRRKRGKKN